MKDRSRMTLATFRKENEEIEKYIANDPELSKLEIDTFDKYILIMRLIDERTNNKFQGYVPGLSTAMGYWSIVYYATPEQVLKERRRKMITIKGEDSRDFKATLKDFNVNTQKRKIAKKYADDIVETMTYNATAAEKKKTIGLYIHSAAFQIGKTYLANAISNELADKKINGVFVFAPSLVSQAREFKNLESIMRELKECQVLVIDDLGAEYRSEWFRLEVLMPVLQNRLSTNKLTIITSNYSLNELKSLYKQNTNPVDVDRLISRILELCRVIELDE